MNPSIRVFGQPQISFSQHGGSAPLFPRDCLGLPFASWAQMVSSCKREAGPLSLSASCPPHHTLSLPGCVDLVPGWSSTWRTEGAQSFVLLQWREKCLMTLHTCVRYGNHPSIHYLGGIVGLPGTVGLSLSQAEMRFSLYVGGCVTFPPRTTVCQQQALSGRSVNCSGVFHELLAVVSVRQSWTPTLTVFWLNSFCTKESMIIRAVG